MKEWWIRQVRYYQMYIIRLEIGMNQFGVHIVAMQMQRMGSVFSLTRVMNKVRIALGDTADNPRFIETLPRRGYRFVAPVSITNNLHDQGLSDMKPIDNSASSTPPFPEDIGVQAGTKRKWAAAALIAAGALTVTKLLLAE